MKRNVDELHERMDSVILLAKAIRRTTEEPRLIAEEVYDELHRETAAAELSLVTAWKGLCDALAAAEAGKP